MAWGCCRLVRGGGGGGGCASSSCCWWWRRRVPVVLLLLLLPLVYFRGSQARPPTTVLKTPFAAAEPLLNTPRSLVRRRHHKARQSSDVKPRRYGNLPSRMDWQMVGVSAGAWDAAPWS